MDERTQKLFLNLGKLDYETEIPEMVLSNIYELDRLVQGFTFDCVTIWTGITNSGKTTMLTLIANQTIQQGEKVFYFNGEQTPQIFLNTLIKQVASEKDIYQIEKPQTPIYRKFVRKEKAEAIKRTYIDNLFLFDNNAPRDVKSLLYAMETCKNLYGTRVFILDNFMQIELLSNDVYQEQSQIMEELRSFAVTQKVHIHLVAHPRKMAEFQTRLSLYDISGSMNLANKAYNVISIMRIDNMDKDGPEYKKLEVQLLKDHFDIRNANAILEVLKTKGERCGLVPLVYEQNLKTYRGLSTIPSESFERVKQEILSERGRK